MPTSKLLAALLLTLALLVGSTGAAAAVEEDDPAWNCETMGNEVCGLVAAAYITALDGSKWVQVFDGRLRLVHESKGWAYYPVAFDGSIWLQVWDEGWLLFDGLAVPVEARR